MTRDKEGHCTLIKRSICSRTQGNTKGVHTQEHSFQIHKMKTVRTERKTDKSMIIVTDSNIPLSVIDRTRRQKINRNRQDLNNVFKQLSKLTLIGYSTQKRWDARSFQAHVKHATS